MPQADLPVVEIVRGGDLHATRPEFAVDVAVGDHGDRAAGERQRYLLADQRAVALVVGIDRDGDVAQHRLGSRRGDGDRTGAIGQRVADLPELALLLFAFHLEIRNGRAELGIPVDEPLAAIDEAVVVQPHERLPDRGGQALVHREALARPVARRAEPSHLARDRRAGFLFPRPHPLDEFLAAEIVPRNPFGAQLVLDHDLRRDTGMVGAELPQRVEAAHPVVTGQHVHQRLLERMAHVQRAGDVRRRQLNAERRRPGGAGRLEVAARFPDRVPLGFNRVRFEALGEFHGVAAAEVAERHAKA